jgi:predicted deacetylase
MKDVVTSYWFNYKMATIELGDMPPREAEEHVLKTKFAVITIHDVSPLYSEKILEVADQLEKLQLKYNFAVIPYHNEKKQNDVRKNSDLIKIIKTYNRPIALHGLYHEHNGDPEEFHDLSMKDTEDEIKRGMNILNDMAIKTDVFVPPTWTVTKQTMEVLSKLGFNIVETDEEILILKKSTRLHADTLNWDRGSKEMNKVFCTINKQLYEKKVMGNTQLIRIAIHPKDDKHALEDQKEMLQGLKEINYTFLHYDEIEGLFG